MKRQAARFKIFAYSEEEAKSYPASTEQEIKIGDEIGGKTVTDIIWTVHVANKKANTFVLEVTNANGAVIDNYGNGNLPPIRNASLFAGDEDTEELAILNNPERVAKLTIDFGPRTIKGANAAPVRFDAATRSVGLQRGCRLQGAAGLSQVLAGQVVPRWSLFPDRRSRHPGTPGNRSVRAARGARRLRQGERLEGRGRQVLSARQQRR